MQLKMEHERKLRQNELSTAQATIEKLRAISTKRLSYMQHEMQHRQDGLFTAQATVEGLEEELSKTQGAKDQLVNHLEEKKNQEARRSAMDSLSLL